MFEVFSENISKYFSDKGINFQVELQTPPSVELGDFSIILNKIAGKSDPMEFAKMHLPELKNIEFIDSVEIFEIPKKKKSIVYLNFKINEDKKNEMRIKFITEGLERILSDEYIEKKNSGKIAIVEHTSANPISPLHIGNLRNSVHGDTIARILEMTGFEVYRHFYVNDVGLQISFVVLGYVRLTEKGITPDTKPDLWFGRIYAIMNNLYYIFSLQNQNSEIFVKPSYRFSSKQMEQFTAIRKSEIQEIEKKLNEYSKIEKPGNEVKVEIRVLNKKMKKLESEINEIKKLNDIQKDLESRFPNLFSHLYNEFKGENIIELTSNNLVSYEKGSDSKVKNQFREMANIVLDSFDQTLKRFNINFDQRDYESDVAWSGLVAEVLDKLSHSKNIKETHDGTLRYQYPNEAIEKMVSKLNIDPSRIPIKGNIPELQIRRKDGTALYASKDIAYSVYKYNKRKPDLILNVISTEQSLPQFQLLLPLYELGYQELAKNMIHYSYELVELKGTVMSGRLALYVTADEYFDETLERARRKKEDSDEKRDLNLIDIKEEERILNEVAIAATRFPLINTSPRNRIVIDLERILDFESNYGPYVQYAHARTCSIFTKIDTQDLDLSKADLNSLTDDLIFEIIDHLLNLNKVLTKSIEQLDPSNIASWLHQLALKFMKFYERYPIMSEKNIGTQTAKLFILQAIQQGLKLGLTTLGIPASTKL